MSRPGNDDGGYTRQLLLAPPRTVLFRSAPANRSEVLATTREPAYLLPSTCLPGLRYNLPSEMRDRIETSNAAESHGSAATSTTARAILKGLRRTANLPFHLIGYQC